MRMHWWQSIRWRLALGSVAVVILATAIMALSAIVAIAYYYGSEQQENLAESARVNAQSLSENYAKGGTFVSAINGTFPTRSTSRALATSGTVHDSHGENYLFLVFNQYDRLVFPTASQLAAHNRAIWSALIKVLRRNALNGENASTGSMRTAVLQAQKGITTRSEIGPRYLGLFPRPFIAVPIRSGAQADAPIVGVLLMTPVSAANNTLPDFVNEVGQVVLCTSLIVAILAALAAILFARTITRPLAKVTEATRVLTSGDYSARFLTHAPGELGELAHNFNDMATQLQLDVEELRKQELWRRELIMSITHDLATPLTAIAGLGDALVDGVNQSREDYEETGRVIVRETLRLRRLVKDLHMMAKVEAGALVPQSKPVRLAPLVDEVLAVLVTEFERARVEPLNMVSYSLPTVAADPDMLTRVVSNLCDNALQYTPPGGSVKIEAQQQANMLAVAITDTGQGIPPDAVGRIFERFFRADTARQSRTGGSGLGLAIVRAIVEAHGGRIWAENVPDAGARFIFTLPLTQQPPSVSDEATLHLHRKFGMPGGQNIPLGRGNGTPAG
jgi:signal transduction histidine kinase